MSVAAGDGWLDLRANMGGATVTAGGMASLRGATSLLMGTGGPMSMAAGDRFDVSAAGAVSVTCVDLQGESGSIMTALCPGF